uniref:Uncharacterized protein n=1 Tax=Lygus hesperus TaxID=30085 RepID=A0A146LFS3_LYGHE
MEEFIMRLKIDVKNRKRIFGKFYTMLLIGAHFGQILKKPISFILSGKGKNEVDGENNLIWETPYGMYIPHADWWSVYVISTIVNYCGSNLVAFTAVGSVITYQYISEELLAEYAVVSKTLGSCVERAERLYVLRKDETSWSASGKELTMNDCLIRCLNLSVKHHLQVLRMTDMFKKLMNIPLFMVIFDGGIVLCISAYLIISEDVSMNLKAPMPSVIAAEAILVLIFCYYGEKITEASQNVGDSIYNNELNAGGFTPVNHNTFANVLSTAYSYIGFLLST